MRSTGDNDGVGDPELRATVERISREELALLLGSAGFAPGQVPLPWALGAGGLSEVPTLSGGLVAVDRDADEVVIDERTHRFARHLGETEMQALWAEVRAAAAEVATSWLTHALDGDPQIIEARFVHLECALASVENLSDSSPWVELADVLAAYLKRQGRVAEALPLLRRSLLLEEQAAMPLPERIAIGLKSLGDALSTLGELDESRQCYERSFSLSEDADVASCLGLVLVRLNQDEQARPWFERAIDLQIRDDGPQSESLIVPLVSLAELHGRRGDGPAAKPLLERTLAIAAKALGPDDSEVAELLEDSAAVHRALGDRGQAREYLEAAVRIRELHRATDLKKLGFALSCLGDELLALGETALAEVAYARALHVAEEVDDGTLPYALVSLASCQLDARRPEDAKGSLERARALVHRLGEGEGPRARIASDLGRVHRELRDERGARALFAEALERSEAQLGPDHPAVAADLAQLARSLATLGELAEAQRLFERALVIRDRVDHPKLRDVMADLAGVLEKRGDAAAALPLRERALEHAVRLLGPEHDDVAKAMTHLAHTLGELGQSARGEELLRRALAHRERILGPEHPNVGRSCSNLARVLTGEHLTEARSLLERALDLHTRSLGPFSEATAIDAANLARVMFTLGETGEAMALIERALTIHEQNGALSHGAIDWSSKGSMLRRLGDLGGARNAWERCLELSQRVVGPDHVDLVEPLDLLGWVTAMEGETAVAMVHSRRALGIAEGKLIPGHPLIRRLRLRLEQLEGERPPFG